ncbi:MAG: class I SAM-dependent RNA methyltransferase, partial [Ruminococcaceae bacterium]|nr:class I SAM-dependent RNA methyltransferase [Oscillospiraceae bacterium]
MKKNDLLNVTVTDINHIGLGVAKCDGAVIFVQGGVTEDVLKIKIIKEAKSYYVARIEDILSPSPYRAEPICPSYKRCGGCIYQNITPEYENKLKEARVKNEFSRFGVRCKSFEPIAYAKLSNYRNKLQCPVSEDGMLGFYAQKSHEIIDIESCGLQEVMMEEIYSYIRTCVQSHPRSEIRHIYLRCGVGTGEVMVCFVCRGES